MKVNEQTFQKLQTNQISIHLFQENPIKNRVSKSQEKIAEDLFKNKIQKTFPKEFWSRFKHFDFYIIVPKFLSLGIHLVLHGKISVFVYTLLF